MLSHMLRAAVSARFVDIRTAAVGSSTTITVNTPNRANGDLLLFIVTLAGSGTTNLTVSTPAGWTLLSGNATGTTAFQPGMYVFYRTVDGTESSSYTATLNSTFSQAQGAILSLTNVATASLANGTTATGSATADITATTVTATAQGILLFIGMQCNNNQGVPTFTPPTGMTEVADVSFNGTTADSGTIIAVQQNINVGATGSRTATSSTSAGTNRFRALLVTASRS